MTSSRRTVLTAITAGSVAFAGCSTLSRSPSPDDPPAAGVDELPDPGDHIYGADGSWSSFGCNASNTREVADGEAPVDGVTERWRTEIAQTAYREPVVADGRVYQPEVDTLRVFDAADGSELWTFEDTVTAPLVSDDVAYSSTRDAVYALEAETGERVWKRAFETPGRVATPSTYAGEELICGVGERVVALDAETGDIEWEREVFGQVLDHPAYLMGYWIVVATEAGMVYLLGDEGMGQRRWNLPSPPVCPPSADTDAVYVTCENGTTYALLGDSTPDSEILWSANTGRAERGIAVADGIVFTTDGRELHALRSDTGVRYWSHDVGDWRHTAPAYGRETVFVGGDRLRALDPAPGGDPDDGPALRFDHAFAGRVGSGPVLDDGVIYVTAEVERETYALLALE